MAKSDFTEIHQSLIKNKSTELTIREINFSDKVNIDGLPGEVPDSWFSCLTLPKPKSIGEVIFSALKSNKSVLKLTIVGTLIQEEEVRFLAEALKVNKTLISLDLSGISVEGGGVDLLKGALKCNDSLLELSSVTIKRTPSEVVAAFSYFYVFKVFKSWSEERIYYYFEKELEKNKSSFVDKVTTFLSATGIIKSLVELIFSYMVGVAEAVAEKGPTACLTSADKSTDSGEETRVSLLAEVEGEGGG